MNEDLNSRRVLTDLIDMPRLESPVYRTVASPGSGSYRAIVLLAVAAKLLMRIPKAILSSGMPNFAPVFLPRC
jgi:hypothetical protein